jgi:hypothetical protein
MKVYQENEKSVNCWLGKTKTKGDATNGIIPRTAR